MRAMLYHAGPSASGPDFGPTRACAAKMVLRRTGRDAGTRYDSTRGRQMAHAAAHDAIASGGGYTNTTDYNCSADAMSQKTFDILVL
jgi:hypothetical protein